MGYRYPQDEARSTSDLRKCTLTSTAEYAVGTLGAATCAAVLVHLGADGWFFEQLREIFVRALDPTTLVEHLRRGRPWTPIG